MRKNKIIAVTIFFLCILLFTSCAKVNGINNDEPPSKIIAISLFKCDCDPLLQETIQDTFIVTFFNESNAKPIKGEDGDIVIKGIITTEKGHSAAVDNFSASSATGAYVSGITFQVYKDGKMIATRAFSQNLGQGVLYSPINLAQRASSYILKVLIRQNEIGRK
jgi:hypothetical protein